MFPTTTTTTTTSITTATTEKKFPLLNNFPILFYCCSIEMHS